MNDAVIQLNNLVKRFPGMAKPAAPAELSYAAEVWSVRSLTVMENLNLYADLRSAAP
ncbi:hypothetical protein T636_A1456 [Enterobacter hormaechei subsp. xiangfangensis]|nr:hypothetical protein [Enterobacter hormaechei]KHG49812.1 hypothetical protein T636_A1456 [Enterobacter hormaechei subsp. xiangfangensis]